MLNRTGWIALAVMAALAGGLYVFSHWPADCKRVETREVEMTHNGRFGGGLRKHQYKVCVE